jgi:cytochrome c-type protein NapB
MRPTPVRPPLSQRLLLAAVAAASMGTAIVAIYRTASTESVVDPPVAEVSLVRAGAPVAAESQVFRMAPGLQAVNPGSRRRNTAHPRTLATERLLRSYPGAPPRVPHGLTAFEFRTNHCNTCHERGGFSQRFAAYAPVTPHPELAACLQCHATNSAQFGLAVPTGGPNATCRQCHSGTPVRFDESAVDWRSAPWPVLSRGGNATRGAPPVIPHDLQMRGNCLACHMGPGAVAEVRTAHAERADCRACHPVGGVNGQVFVRARAPAAQPGGMAR